MVNYDDEPLFHVDSVDKQILMVSDEGGHIRITNDDIIGESFELTESLCSEENLRLNSVESSQIKFRVKNTFPNLYRVWFTVTITMDGAEEPFLLGKYKVWKDKVSSDRDTREITAYDGLYKILTNTYKKWYNEFWSSRSTATMKQFRDAYFTRLQVSHPWISQQSVTLVNDGVILKKSTKIKKISGKDILGTICELNGVCGRIGRDNKFHYIEINKPATVYTIDNSLNIVDDYEDYNTTTIDRVEILSQSGDVLGASGEEQDEAENTYTIENGFLLKGLGNDDDARIKAVSMAQGILTKINNAGYIPFEGEFKGNPCYEVGDRIRFTAHGNTVETLILNRIMRGVQSLHDVYSATGDDTYPDNTNTYSSKTKEIDHKLGDLDSEVGDINTKLENAPTFEVNPDGTVSVSTNNNNEGSYIRTFKMIMYHPYPEHVIPAPYYQIWEVTVHSTSGVVLCFAPHYDSGGNRRTFTLNGKTYYDTIVNIVTTSENSYVTQKWVGGIPMSSGLIFCPYGVSYEWDQPHYLSHFTGYGTVTDSPYYEIANGAGALIYDTYSGTASTDRSFVSQSGNYQGTYYYAMVNENVDVPGTSGTDVKTFPTATDGYDLANSADSLAKATQGQTYERKTPGFTGQINVMPTESIQTVTKSLDVVRENLPEANPTGEATATATTLKLNGTIYNLGGGGGASALSELTDVELTSVANGELLKYDETEEKWINDNSINSVIVSMLAEISGIKARVDFIEATVITFKAYLSCTSNPGAQITATINNSTYSGIADANGEVTIPVGIAGIYSVQATLEGVTSPSKSAEVQTNGQVVPVDIPVTVVIVPWSTGTDVQIVGMIEAAREGRIDLQQCGWAVGDVRTIQISAFTGGASHAAQSVELVITSFAEYMSSGNVLQFDFKNALIEGNRMNATATNVGGYEQSEMRVTTLPALVNALPTWLKDLLIEFSVLVSAGNASSTINTVTGNKLALRSEVEMFGSYGNTYAGEGTAIPYYSGNRNNRIKKNGISGSACYYWSRSPAKGDDYRFFNVSGGGNGDKTRAEYSYYMAPFGCL